jgi:uncharacterized membrane protein
MNHAPPGGTTPPRTPSWQIFALAAIGVAVATILVTAPLIAWSRLVRLQAVLVPAFALAMLVIRPWRWSSARCDALRAWYPSRRVAFVACVVATVTLYWLVLTAFRSGQINAIDFTLYFDRPAFQTLHGRPVFIETTDISQFSNRTALGLHAYWAMLPLAGLYAIRATPQWLLALSVIAVVAGAVHVLRIAQHLRLGGLLACATALAFLLNDNTARTLGYGFHAEVLYAWFVPWMLDAGLRRKPVSFLAATLACVSVKEDAIMPVFAVCAALALDGGRTMTWRKRAVYLMTPVAVALGNLVVYYRWVVPVLSASRTPFYGGMWANYGPTPLRALLAMATRPWSVIGRAMTSGFLRKVVVSHLFLPIIGWRWAVGIVPIVLLYGASANEQLRTFGIYYAIVLVPFLVIGASVGAVTVTRWLHLGEQGANLLPATVILLGAMMVGGNAIGGGGYTLRPWRPEIGAVPSAIAALSAEPVILVQSGLYIRAGYQPYVRLLTPQAVSDPANAGAVMLIAPDINGYPLTRQDVAALAHLQSARSLGSGLLAVRLPR